MTTRIGSLSAFLLTAAIGSAGHPTMLSAQVSGTGGTRTSIALDVDATDAPMKILHATMTMPAQRRRDDALLSEMDPRRAHAVGTDRQPHGPAHLRRRHGARWRRDLVEMNAFAITVPAGAKTLTAKYDYVVPTAAARSGSTASTNAKIAVINWYTVGLYPMGENPPPSRSRPR